MKRMFTALGVSILILACDENSRLTSPTAPRDLVVVEPTPEPARYAVYGVVSELTRKGEEPVEGAWVAESSEFHAGTYTAADGSYRFTGLYEGTNTFWVSKVGYQDATRKVDIDGELRVDIELVRR